MAKGQLCVMFTEFWLHKLDHFGTTVILLLVVFFTYTKNANMFLFQKFKKYSTDYRKNKRRSSFTNTLFPFLSYVEVLIIMLSIYCIYFQNFFCAFIYTYVYKHTD